MSFLPAASRLRLRASVIRPAAQRGYALTAVVVLAVTASLVVLGRQLDASWLRSLRSQDTAAALQLARAALAGYATSYRDKHLGENFGYLPCPDTTGSGSAHTPCGTSGSPAIGLLPYRTLGLPELRDADGGCLWYAVSGSFKNSPKASPFNWDTRGQLSIHGADGRLLAAPDDAAGGAAAVVVAPGPALRSQRREPAAGCADAADAAAYLENDGTDFINGVVADRSGAVLANDRLAWITPKDIFDAVVRRGDFAAYMNAGIAAIRSRLADQPAAADGALPAGNPFARDTTEYNFYGAWQDQFRYLRCAEGECYADLVDGGHRAVLLFGGRKADGAPRAAAARSLPDYFEAALGVAEGREFVCDADPPAFDNASGATRAIDLVLCLAP